jgi:hypothetical protein
MTFIKSGHKPWNYIQVIYGQKVIAGITSKNQSNTNTINNTRLN